MHVIRSNSMAWALVALIAFVCPAAAANVWTAELDVEEALEAYGVRIVATSEEDCLAQASAYHGAVVIEACHPVEASRIQDDGTGGRGSSRTLGNVQPNPGSDGGTAAGAGRAVGGAGNMGGGH